MTKYRAVKEIVDGFTFASKHEAKRYRELKLLERAGQIRGLELQPRFPLVVNGKKICTYVADFVFHEDNRRIVEDAKGFRTRDYIIKRKLLLALNPGMDHREV